MNTHANTRGMYMVHTMFRREFTLMPTLIRNVKAGDIKRTQIVADHIELLTTALHHHHEGEDKHLWPKLLDRGTTEIDSVVHLIESQHEKVARELVEMDAAVRLWHSSAASEFVDVLVDSTDRVILLINEHMDVEESYILPLVHKYVTAQEWDLMVDEAAAAVAPDDLPLLVGMLMYEGDPKDVQQALSRLPEEVRQALLKSAPHAFASYAQLVYDTTTPPRINNQSKSTRFSFNGSP